MRVHEDHENGAIEFRITDDDGNERAIRFRPNDDGSFDVTAKGPNGEKSNTIDLSGGSTALGQ